MQFRKRPAKIQGVSFAFDAVPHRARPYTFHEIDSSMTFVSVPRDHAAPPSA
ncbi:MULTISPECIES: hypothetical protein [unclassified Caballeronia]|uniref:hypothetical protein n=1 Tax=unclassified Caballeronia TaxID=2646786 RepID=UPI0002E37EAD|nr:MULTISPECIES: hypothetical protein [unclassified Caballeronia]MCE4542800.1 hypothetical protein [Caballeronia sp. PC1]MCE4568144.1 hypothetical protein [Caballeronia sp. CLC5]